MCMNIGKQDICYNELLDVSGMTQFVDEKNCNALEWRHDWIEM